MTTLQELGDRLAIRDLIERYAVSVTRRNWGDLAACFHPQGSWRVLSPEHPDFELFFSTPQGIGEGIGAIVDQADFNVQMTHSAVIDDLTADRARASVIMNEMGRTSANKAGFSLWGVYSDVITQVDGRWKFETRVFRPFYLDTTWLPGQVMVDYAAKP